MEEKPYRYRLGPGIKWQDVTSRSIISGYTVDNLNTKSLEDTDSPFEKLFVLIREELLKNESRCMDSEEDRLHLCQVVSDKLDKELKKNGSYL